MSASVPAPQQEQVVLEPYLVSLSRLAGRDVRVTVVSPPYPCVGVGELRVIRSRESDDVVTLDLTYERYERLP
ncbi:MAG: hypothetical protein M3Z37_06220 [Candidatus Eremiobacteraeota bacterium]|nr:hypothetical protein [Candidatus Eremiobacteraeota bacterium]